MNAEPTGLSSRWNRAQAALGPFWFLRASAVYSCAAVLFVGLRPWVFKAYVQTWPDDIWLWKTFPRVITVILIVLLLDAPTVFIMYWITVLKRRIASADRSVIAAGAVLYGRRALLILIPVFAALDFTVPQVVSLIVKQDFRFSVAFAPTGVWSVLLRYLFILLSCDGVCRTPVIQLKGGWLLAPLAVWLFSGTMALSFFQLMILGINSWASFTISALGAAVVWYVATHVILRRS